MIMSSFKSMTNDMQTASCSTPTFGTLLRKTYHISSDKRRVGKQFSIHVGTEPPLSGYYQYFLGSECALLKDTTRFDPSGA